MGDSTTAVDFTNYDQRMIDDLGEEGTYQCQDCGERDAHSTLDDLERLHSFIRPLRARVQEQDEVIADKRRLTRELDIALSGESNAAEQASLCDLLHPARELRARVAQLEARDE